MRGRESIPARDRAFILAVACVAALAVLVLAKNVRESTAPLYGPPTVDKEVVMAKVEAGQLSFVEARFYVLEEDGGGVPDDPALRTAGEAVGQAATGAPGKGAGEEAGDDATGASDEARGRASGEASGEEAAGAPGKQASEVSDGIAPEAASNPWRNAADDATHGSAGGGVGKPAGHPGSMPRGKTP